MDYQLIKKKSFSGLFIYQLMISHHAFYSGLFFTHFYKPYLKNADEDRLAGGLI